MSPIPTKTEVIWQNTTVANFILRYQGYQKGVEISAAENNYNKTISQLVNDVTTSIDNGLAEPYRIAIRGIHNRTGECGGHALLPYKYERNGDEVTVFVYDSNHPYKPNNLDNNQKIIFNTKSNNWIYNHNNSIGIWGSQKGCAKITALPLSLWKSRPTPPWDWLGDVNRTSNLRAANIEPFHSIVVNGESHLLIVDSQGQALGYRNGQFVSEIPKAVQVIPIAVLPDVTPDYPEVYNVGADSIFSLNMVYTSTGQAQVNDFGPNGIIGITGVASQGNVTDTINIAPNAQSVTITAGSLADGRAITILKPHTDLEKELTVGDFTLDSQGVAHLTMTSPDQQSDRLAFTSSSSDKYFVQMTQTGMSGTVEFSATNIAINAGDTQFVTLNWDNADKATLQIDQGSDGTVDKTVSLVNQATAIQSTYLPIIIK